MAIPELETTARAIVADGKGILAADETPGTLTKRLTARGIESTPDTRRAYREMFFSTQGVAEFISGVILDETIRQRSQDHPVATMHLSAINQVEGPKPWKLSYSYGRALQDEALNAWRGRQENLAAAQQAFSHRAKCDTAAVLGRYTTSMETESVVA